MNSTTVVEVCNLNSKSSNPLADKYEVVDV